MKTLIDRFWEKVKKSRKESGCWEWTGAKCNAGYGMIFIKIGFAERAHRISVRMTGREIPSGMATDHLCRNRGCVNPAHLEVVTVAENFKRGNSRNMVIHRTGKCGRGHPMKGENVYVRNDTGGRMCLACRRFRRKNKGLLFK